MLHTNYQDSRLCGFKKEDFYAFPIFACVKHVTQKVGPFFVTGPHFKQIWQLKRLTLL